MSNALVDNIGNASGSLVTPTQYVVRGSAKVWANLNGTGTIALRDSLNVSSVVDNGTGDYTSNWANAFANADYAPTGVTGTPGSAVGFIALPFLAPGNQVVGSIRVGAINTAGSAFDASHVNVDIKGDLA